MQLRGAELDERAEVAGCDQRNGADCRQDPEWPFVVATRLRRCDWPRYGSWNRRGRKGYPRPGDSTSARLRKAGIVYRSLRAFRATVYN
ncbi:MAG TPA: hypothetical protein VJV78_39575 [Polyangiales bacterium]|nr:hypothetical protein [Polyangiales bacterium]